MTSHGLRFLGVLVAAALLAGCAGESHGSSMLPTSPTTNGRGTGTAVFVINTPQRSASAASRSATSVRTKGVRPQYLSTATQSIVIAISGPTTVNETAGLTVNSSGCTSTLASTICTLTVPGLQAGSYTATLTTYDGYTSGSNTATGNVLSAAQAIAFTITAGQSNTINISLSGVPASTVVVPANSNSSANGNGGYDIIGQGAHEFIAESLDADGNIIAGAGAPLFSIGAVSGSLSPVTTSPSGGSTTSASAPNSFTVTPPATFASTTASFTVTPTFTGQATDGCAQTGANCAAVTVTVDMKYLVRLFVANNPGNNVTEYAPPYTSAPTATISNGMSNPTGLAFDSSGNLFVVNSHNNTVKEYAPPYTGAPTATISNGVNSPWGTALDSSNNLFVANNGGSNVTEYAPPYTGAPTTTISNGVNSPWGPAFDSSGDLFVANYGGSNVTEYAPPFSNASAPTTTISNGVRYATGLAFDSSGDLFVANAGYNTVIEYASPYTGTPIATISNAVNMPEGLAFDFSGNLFVANYNNTVTEYAPPFTNTNAPVATISNAVNRPQGLAILKQP
ncbi:MAG: NHL repeat-containing protein [Vulcanimicrobiaceae bacterium]